jgi:hypothetical protein
VGDASGASCLATERVNHGVLVGNAKRYARGGIGALRAGEWLAGMGEEEEAKLCQAPKGEGRRRRRRRRRRKWKWKWIFLTFLYMMYFVHIKCDILILDLILLVRLEDRSYC